jgi:hypothetical protein
MKKICNVLWVLGGAFLFVAAAFLFQCPPMESGAYMNCHQANLAVTVLSVVIVASGIGALLTRRRGISISFSGVAVLASGVAAIVPGVLVELCMMPEMTCRAVFRPVDIFCSAVVLLSAAVYLASEIKGGAR